MKVLVGIPTLNDPGRLRRCLTSVKEHTDLAGVKVLVSDDASTAEYLEHNKTVVHEFGVPMLTTETRLGVSKQWNRLVSHVSNAEIVVLLNDDVEVVADWLDVLVFSIQRNPHAGMVGLRSETGVTRSNGQPRPRVDYNESRLLDGGATMLSSGGACFAFRRADWKSIGGFDERYFYFYEEIDFGVSMVTKLGRFNYVADYPVVYHVGGATTTHVDPQPVLVASRQKFVDKWRTTLDSLRSEFGQRTPPKTTEWNSHWKNWRHP